MHFSAIIVAAGTSRRMGFDKLMAKLAGRCVLRYSIDAFLATPGLVQLVVVTDSARFERVRPTSSEIPIQRVDGGQERQDSVLRGLQMLDPKCDLVAVHDGARPLVTPEAILRTLKVAEDHRAAACAHRLTETIKRADDQTQVCDTIKRENLWAMETPQCFHRGLLLEAYQKVCDQGLVVTDEVSALESLGIATTLVENRTPNLKITYPQDLPLTEHLLKYVHKAS